MGFDRADLLRQAGYEEGDRIVTPVHYGIDGSVSTTSGSFQLFAGARGFTRVDFNQYPDNATIEVRMIGQTAATMNADGDYRVTIDVIGGQTVETPTATVSQGNTFTRFVSDAVEVPDRGIADIEQELRSDGTNTISYFTGGYQIETVL